MYERLGQMVVMFTQQYDDSEPDVYLSWME